MGGRELLAKRHAALKKLTSTTISVGVHKDAGQYDNGMKVSDVAVINHFGSLDGRIPSRPFMTIAQKESHAAVASKMKEAARAAAKGNDGVAIFKLAGQELEKSAKGVIDSISALTPNAPSTIAKKGRNHPLYDTGRMRNSVTTKERSD